MLNTSVYEEAKLMMVMMMMAKTYRRLRKKILTSKVKLRRPIRCIESGQEIRWTGNEILGRIAITEDPWME